MTLLALAEEGANRRQLLAELARACSGRGLYAGSQDELTRPAEDPLSLVPAAYLCLRLLLNPAAAGALVRRAVDNYALSEAAARTIRQLPADCRSPITESRWRALGPRQSAIENRKSRIPPPAGAGGRS
jgi:hypothetical protein